MKMTRHVAALVVLMNGGIAQAGPGVSPPTVSLGEVPYEIFSGELCSTEVTLLTVPEGQEFIITLVTSTINGYSSTRGDWEGGTQLRKDGAILLTGSAFNRAYSVSVTSGSGRLPVEPGATLSIQGMDTGCGHYYLQGYYVQAGSPYRAYFGNSVDRDVLTVEDGKTFLVRTIALSTRESPGHCHAYVDGAKTIDGNTFLIHDRGSYDGGPPGGFAIGKGTLVLRSGQTLQVGPDDPGEWTQCDYYVEGEYIQP